MPEADGVDVPGRALDSSMFAFVTDFADAGIESTLDNIVGRGGVAGVTVAATYHTARDVFPHARSRRLRFLAGGTHYYRPEPDCYRHTTIAPRVADEVGDGDLLGDLRAATRARGVALHAWAVFLHNSRAGFAHPDCAQRTVHGDPVFTSLCPANPQVRGYARGLARDLARFGFESIVAESLHYHGLRHGYHHERYLVRLDPLAEFAFGLCFCTHCRSGARAAAVDVASVAAFCTRVVDSALAGGSESAEFPELTGTEVRDLVDGELGAFLAFRADVVAGLVAEVAGELSGTELAFVDPSGGRGFLTGELTGPYAAETGWSIGIDPAGIADHADTYLILGYTADARRLRDEIAAYQRAIGDRARLRCALRPTWPDCVTTESLAEKLAVLREQQVGGVDFYHYGLMPLACTDRVGQALLAGLPISL